MIIQAYDNLPSTPAAINMVICHAIAVSDATTFKSYMSRMQDFASSQAENKDPIVERALTLMNQDDIDTAKSQVKASLSTWRNASSWSKLALMAVTTEMRNMMCDALSTALMSNRQILAFDLIAYARKRNINLAINEACLAHLIKSEEYMLLEDLMNANCYIQVTFSQANKSQREALKEMWQRVKYISVD